jgi:hypothetical protein
MPVPARTARCRVAWAIESNARNGSDDERQAMNDEIAMLDEMQHGARCRGSSRDGKEARGVSR